MHLPRTWQMLVCAPKTKHCSTCALDVRKPFLLRKPFCSIEAVQCFLPPHTPSTRQGCWHAETSRCWLCHVRGNTSICIVRAKCLSGRLDRHLPRTWHMLVWTSRQAFATYVANACLGAQTRICRFFCALRHATYVANASVSALTSICHVRCKRLSERPSRNLPRTWQMHV